MLIKCVFYSAERSQLAHPIRQQIQAAIDAEIQKDKQIGPGDPAQGMADILVVHDVTSWG